MSNMLWKSRPFLTLVCLALAVAPGWSQQPAASSTPAPAASPAPTAETYVAQGIENGKKGNLDAAVAAFNEAIKLDPKYTPAYENRGKALMYQHKLTDAIADYGQAIQLDPNDKEALYRRGSLKGQTGDFDGSVADFNRLIELAPQASPAYYYRGHVKYFKGDLDGAMTDLDQSITLDQSSPYSYFIHGLIRHARKDQDGAAADFQKSVDNGYDYSAFWVWITQTEAGKGDAARTALTNALANQKLFKPDDWPVTLGNFLLGKVTQDDLIAKAGQGEDAQDHTCEAWFYSGMVKLLAGDKKSAQDCFTKSVATGSKSSEEFVEANRELTALAQNP